MKRISETDFISKWSCIMQWNFGMVGRGGMDYALHPNMHKMYPLSTIVCLQLEAKRCFIKMQRELLLYERMKYIVSGKLMSN